MSEAGIFISFEGSEGCGKTTQIQLLAERLRASGREVVLTREPGGTPIGEQIRHLLQYAKESHAMTSEAELLLFTASRAQLVRELILPALSRGAIVISDRFLDSTTVYQGVARRISAETVAQINAFAVGECLPHLTLLFDLNREESRARLALRPQAAAGKDRMEQQPEAFYEAVRQGYLDLARQHPERIVVIEAARSTGELAGQIWNLLQERFHGFVA